MLISSKFPKYENHETKVPIWCVTPNKGGSFHRFFDTSPFNPSGTHMVLTRINQEDRAPAPGEEAEIVVVNLVSGTETVVAKTSGWESQMGANCAWASDVEVVFNDVDTSSWTPHAVRLNIETKEALKLEGSVYHLSPDGKKALAFDVGAMRRTQPGYGVALPDEHVRRNMGLSDDDGLFMTNVNTGKRKMLMSLREIVEKTTSKESLRDYRDWEVYGFHSKWNLQGDRMLFTLRRFPQSHSHRFGALHHKACLFDVYTMREDGSELFNAVPSPMWKNGGHHINWYPDGQSLSMNLRLHHDHLKFYRVGINGDGLRPILSQSIGSGHPTVHPTGTHILTDTYVHESMAYGDGTTPLRWIEIERGHEDVLARIPTETPAQKTCPWMRLDPHPAWDKSWKYVAFNAFVGGTRRVYVMDMSSLL